METLEFFPISTLCLLERQELEKVLQSNLLKNSLEPLVIRILVQINNKRKFLVDLQREEDFDLLHTTKRSYDATTATNLWGDSNEGIEATAETHASWIVADEFINFIGRGNIDFCNLLGELWDFDEPVYRDRIKEWQECYYSFSCM